jgi:hypothetical protein
MDNDIVVVNVLEMEHYERFYLGAKPERSNMKVVV